MIELQHNIVVKGRNKSGQRRAIKAKQNRVPFNEKGISKLPKSPGLYKINSNGETYIGSTNNLQRRAKEHLKTGNHGTSLSFKRAVTRKQAYYMEKNLIRKSCPSRNVTKPDSCKGFFEKHFGIRI